MLYAVMLFALFFSDDVALLTNKANFDFDISTLTIHHLIYVYDISIYDIPYTYIIDR